MATETAKFALELEDGITAGAVSAEDGLQSLQSQIDKDTKSLAQMKKAMRQMQSASSVDIEAFRKLQSEIDSTQEGIGKARAAFVNLGGDFSKIGKKKRPKLTTDVEKPKALDQMKATVEQLPGPFGKAGTAISGARAKIEGLTAATGVAGAVILGVVGVITLMVAALVALTAATAKATTELLKYAAAQADAMRSERLRLEGLGTLRRWMRLTGKDAAQMSESINRVSETVPLARSQISGYGTELHRLGIRGRAAESALEALSIAQAVQGDRGRQRMMMLVRMAGHSEGAMADLAERVRKELGGNAAAQMRSLTMISTKLRESFQALFTGLNLTPLLSGLFRLSQLLSRNTDSGRALRAIMTAVLTPFIGELGSAAEGIEWFAKELIILALKAAIVFVRVRNAIRDAFGEGILGRIMRTQRAMDAFHILLIAAGIVVGALAVGMAFMVAVIIGAATPLLALSWAIYRIYQAIEPLLARVPKFRELFSPAYWAGAGLSMIEGIERGLRSGVDRLRSAVTGVANEAMNSFRDALGIHSPSRVFAQFGMDISRGVAEGVDRGASEASGAAGRMMSTTTNNVQSVRGGPSRSVTIGELHVHAGEGGEDTAQQVADALRNFFENDLAVEAV